MNNVWIAPVLGLIGVLAGAIVSGIIGEKRSRSVIGSIDRMLTGGSEHRNGARVAKARLKHLSRLIQVCMDLEYEMMCLASTCALLLQEHVHQMPQIPIRPSSIRGADLPENIMQTLANIHAHTYLANEFRIGGDFDSWKAELTTIRSAARDAQILCGEEAASLAARRDHELDRAHGHAYKD